MTLDRSYVERNGAQLERMRVLLGRLTDEQLQRSMGQGWTVAAALAHLAFWDWRTVLLLEKWKRDGIGSSPSDADIINDAALPLWRLIPPGLAAREALAAAGAVDRAVEAASPDLVEAILASRALRLDRSIHRRQHIDEIERAIDG